MTAGRKPDWKVLGCARKPGAEAEGRCTSSPSSWPPFWLPPTGGPKRRTLLRTRDRGALSGGAIDDPQAQALESNGPQARR